MTWQRPTQRLVTLPPDDDEAAIDRHVLLDGDDQRRGGTASGWFNVSMHELLEPSDDTRAEVRGLRAEAPQIGARVIRERPVRVDVSAQLLLQSIERGVQHARAVQRGTRRATRAEESTQGARGAEDRDQIAEPDRVERAHAVEPREVLANVPEPVERKRLTLPEQSHRLVGLGEGLTRSLLGRGDRNRRVLRARPSTARDDGSRETTPFEVLQRVDLGGGRSFVHPLEMPRNRGFAQAGSVSARSRRRRRS